MKRIYADRDSGVMRNLSQSDKMIAAKSRLAMSAQKFHHKQRQSRALAQVSEDLDEGNQSDEDNDDPNKRRNNSKRLGQSMGERMPSKRQSLDDFIDTVEEKNDKVPTMEDLAGLNMLTQVAEVEEAANEDARVSNRNRTGATLVDGKEE